MIRRDRDSVMRVTPRVDCPTKQRLKFALPINPDPSKVVRITLFAELPPVHKLLSREEVQRAA